jgi:hypothetical protein
MTASLRSLPACNTEACGLSRLKNHSALLVRFAPCGQHLAHKTRWRVSALARVEGTIYISFRRCGRHDRGNGE